MSFVKKLGLNLGKMLIIIYVSACMLMVVWKAR